MLNLQKINSSRHDDLKKTSPDMICFTNQLTKPVPSEWETFLWIREKKENKKMGDLPLMREKSQKKRKGEWSYVDRWLVNSFLIKS